MRWKLITPDSKFEIDKRYLLYSNSNAVSSDFQDGTINVIRWEERGQYLIQGWSHYCPVEPPKQDETPAP